ncbi:MAG: hypothetical protein KKH93_05800 [Candidatus Omnitrophica bacterium]|nr:hypothetical protein [Candidatus Omnitrophota bacterium]MBU2044950.1 hypothetical protein [Candidatus Omnitrophota bacterium]MBU2250805.1 hypothetical protein [Candidatus Omnitrophota bacterium]MBU2265915.1 hypothetical protein [Candidatus Omnitrophota bacterium]MBU2473540.1 hypothetical protein [Candidatus Omnitrophota bacterium]
MKAKHRQVSQRSGQLILEYAGLVALTVVTLVTMHVYLNRGVQGKLKESADSFNEEQWADSRQNRDMSKTTTTFSYEGGPYEGSLFTSSSHRSDSMNFRSRRP